MKNMTLTQMRTYFSENMIPYHIEAVISKIREEYKDSFYADPDLKGRFKDWLKSKYDSYLEIDFFRQFLREEFEIEFPQLYFDIAKAVVPEWMRKLGDLVYSDYAGTLSASHLLKVFRSSSYYN